VLFYEDLSENPQGFLDSVCNFVGARHIALDSAGARTEKVYSAPTAAHSSKLGKRTFEAFRWASLHGARPLIVLGQRTTLWKLVRGKFVEDFSPLSEQSAEDFRAMMLPETEELERITGRDLSDWKPRAYRKFDNCRATVRSQTG
jgi:hypothetical protein